MPARFESAVVTFTFLRRLAKDYGLFDTTETAPHALTAYDSEVLAKEITENIVRWGFSEQPGGFIAKASVAESTLTIGFADWGTGFQPNLINKMLRLGGQGQKRITHLVQALYPNNATEAVVRSLSPAPVLRREQKLEIEKRLGPQRFGPGYVLVMRWPTRKQPDIDYQDGAYPANLLQIPA